MRIKRLSKQLFIISLGIFILTAADNIFDSATVYAADTSTISTSSTRSEVQEVVDEGNFDYTQLSDAEIDHIYSLYGNDPETIRQLQKQSNSANPYGVATLSSTTYTHASQFKNSTVMKGIDVSGLEEGTMAQVHISSTPNLLRMSRMQLRQGLMSERTSTLRP